MGLVFNANQEKSILQEVYFGKTKELQKIENQLDIFRNKYMDRYVFNTHVNSDTDLLKFNRMVENYFGFGTFSLGITNQPIVNAYTLPIDYRLDTNTSEELLVDKNTFKFRKEADYCCLVYTYSGIIFNPHYTTDEVFALILHEIGHNFFGCINQKNTPLVDLYKAFLCVNLLYGNLTVLFTTNLSMKVLTNLDIKLRENNSIITSLLDYYGQMCDVISTVLGYAFKIANFLSFNTLSVVMALIDKIFSIVKTSKNPIDIVVNLIMFPTNYRNERLADNFPTMYGYGNSLASALNKMEDHKSSPSKISNEFNKIPLVSTLYNLNALVPSILLTGLDEHPQHIARAQDQLNLLKYEIAKENLDPKMKKVILADIKAIESQMQKYIDISKGVEDPDLAKHLYNKVLYKYTGSRAIKDILLDDRNKYEEYDKVVDRLTN